MTQYYWEVALIVVVFSCIFLSCPFFRGVWPDFCRWLKGSRKSYYFGANQRVVDSSENFRGSIRPVIEINRGLFRRRSAIYGSGPRHWQVAGVSVGRDGTNWIELQERRGLVVGRALELITTYPSLQAILDRIAELERELIQERIRKTEVVAALQALNVKILDGKQRFRSQAAREIRDNITFVLREMVEVDTYRQPVDLWLEKFSKLEAGVLR